MAAAGTWMSFPRTSVRVGVGVGAPMYIPSQRPLTCILSAAFQFIRPPVDLVNVQIY